MKEFLYFSGGFVLAILVNSIINFTVFSDGYPFIFSLALLIGFGGLFAPLFLTLIGTVIGAIGIFMSRSKVSQTIFAGVITGSIFSFFIWGLVIYFDIH